jgi:hypothetical protein
MKTYQYYEQNVDEPITITDQQILYDYWNYWECKMVQKFGDGDPRINHENCIQDWITTHGAWEKKV